MSSNKHHDYHDCNDYHHDCHHDHDHHCPPDELPITEGCCTGTTGCSEWDGTLRHVVTEPIFVQKVYDAALFNLQALSTVNNVRFTPNLPEGSRILRVLEIKCRKFFNPSNIADPRNFRLDPETVLSGGEFLKDEKGKYVEVTGPDGLSTEKLIYADTSECDEEDSGTPVFGTQKVRVRGNVVIDIDLLILDSRGRRVRFSVTANVPVAPVNSPLVLTNFFELCMPSVYNSAFFPRFAEFCNVLCETRLATNSIHRDITICPETGKITIDLIIALCITCEKKIIVPTQLCVLSTGFPELSPDTSPICTTFPNLFPKQIDESSVAGANFDLKEKPFNFSLHEED
ncbi:MAG: hypothetical protein ACTHW2_03000 [Tissierella sp.]|uniref:hypothetical protein n=1 Tax=Tissierella sp. TaxID=41274 RepID=UPI003F958A68